VLATWMDDGFLYPGIVVRLADKTAHVAYLDGDEADVDLADVRHGAIGLELPVSVNFKGKGNYYPGAVKERVGQAVYVVYEDGDRGWATMGQVRVRREVMAALDRAFVACTWCGAALRAEDVRCGACHAPRPGRS
jgi:hypothetical protein